MGEAMPARQSRAGFFAGITISMLFDRLPVSSLWLVTQFALSLTQFARSLSFPERLQHRPARSAR
ncbi:MAG: hypothetical protein K0M47_20695, partial [Rhizobium sp.]|nr:hypothetical protein [Rhizobium sp.]